MSILHEVLTSFQEHAGGGLAGKQAGDGRRTHRNTSSSAMQ